MAFTPEQKRAARAHQNNLEQILDILAERDKQNGKKRYKSEIFDQATLGKIFLGIPWSESQAEDDRRGKKKQAKPVSPYDTQILETTKTKYENADDLLNSFDGWLELRDRARKDLFWLGQSVLKKDFTEGTHRVVCEQFVQKNFDGAFPQGYTIKNVHDAIDRQERFDQFGNPTKEMILLDPRGFFKSTIDGIDAIQWMLNVPDIRILLLTGEYKLGIGFLKEIKKYLYLAEGGEPSDLQLLFPEYITKGIDGTSKEPLTLTIRKHAQVSATIWVNSIDSNLSGWHCDIKKGDDVITDANSNSEDVREALKDKFDGTDNILDPWGFSDNIGTRYFPKDWYGTRLASWKEDPEGSALKYFCRACWTVKPEFSEILLKELTEDMVVLTFPEKENFKKLRKKLLKNEISFRCQQLNEPAGEDADDGPRIQFEEETLRAHLFQSTAAPKDGDIYICWDWALTANKSSDYSVGVAGRVYLKDEKWSICVMEVVCGKFKSSELANQIVMFNRKWNPKKTMIEKSNGSELLSLEVARRANLTGTVLDIFWKPPSLQENAKRNRIKGLETLLADHRLYFVMGPWIDETFLQMIRYTGEKKNRGRKEDIPDAMSYLSFFLPLAPDSKESEEMREIGKVARQLANRKAQYDRMFGSSVTSHVNVFSQPEAVWKPKWPTRN